MIIFAIIFGAKSAFAAATFETIQNNASALPEEALSAAYNRYALMFSDLANPYPVSQYRLTNINFMTVIDYTAPSNQKRMFVINMNDGTVQRFYVAHGKNSGELKAVAFSNINQSYQTSLGAYITSSTYEGKHGKSLNLIGMDETNSIADEREIVLHGADYVSESFIKAHGRAGRSQGCPAVDLKYSDYLVEILKGGSLIYAYGK